ncbi:hypothetical protein [Streptomyces sp. TS71-3]|uniref:DNA polymerase Y family protein n=1 Tax=Streptomyces sp. TS71-3 TaxID=2733862 RepID=UPI001AFF09C8|nr:hypothetical protein [Streptomyces sp. TS71-3]GHJ38617.1 hypothetical protein Sm713_42260 [Streptomyces sp. TS71-3]
MRTGETGRGGPGAPAPADRAAAVLCVRPVEPGAGGLSGLLALLAEFTPVVEALPPDGALADLRGAVGYFGRDAVDLASVLRVRALALYGVDCTIGVGPGPMAARAAARAAAPGTTLAVPGGPDAVAAFLADRPVTAVPGVGSATARALGAYGLHTVGSVAAAPLPAVQRLIGARAGRELHEKARGVDRTRVVPNAAARSVAAERAFDRDELDASEHRRALLSLTSDLGARLRAEGQVCRALTLTVRCADRTGRPLTRSRTLPEPTAHTPALTTAAYRMYEALGLQRARVRTLALRAEGLGPAEHAARQLSLDPADAKARRLEQAADRARARFGPSAVVPGTLAA